MVVLAFDGGSVIVVGVDLGRIVRVLPLRLVLEVPKSCCFHLAPDFRFAFQPGSWLHAVVYSSGQEAVALEVPHRSSAPRCHKLRRHTSPPPRGQTLCDTPSP